MRISAWRRMGPALQRLVLALAICGPWIWSDSTSLARGVEGAIRIGTPLGVNPIELDVGAVVPSAKGWLFRMPISISARDPIVRVTVAGEVHSVAYGT